MKNFTDEQLVRAYFKGNEKALEELIGRYLPLIYTISRRYTGDADNASDIVQEVFVKAWKNLNKFDRSKKFKAWLITIAKNAALDWLKKKNAIPFSLLKESEEDENFEAKIADSKQISVLDQISREALSCNLALAVGKLPAKYGSVINLYHKDDLNFREIADFLNESINTVKSRYRRGLIALRGIIGEDDRESL